MASEEISKPQTVVEQKVAEEVLRQVQLIVDNSHDAIIGETLDGIITTWNGGAVKMFGYTEEEVVGKSALLLAAPELQSELPILLEKVKSGQVIPDHDTVRICKDGTRIDVALSISPVKMEDGVIIGMSIVERDISERKKDERHIKELNEVQNKFISIISHQLRTPLTSVNWNLEMLLNGDFGKLEETQRKFLQVTHHSSMEITRRIHDLLTAMDIEEDRVQFEKVETAVDSVCASVVQSSTKKCEFKNLFCAYTGPTGDLPVINADGDKLRKVISGLLDNAIAYTKDDGKIAISLTLTADAIRFEVIDTGIGIPEAEQHRVFTRFFRASNASVMQPDANGLSLFIAKSFIEQHGGKIGYESAEGKGTTFWFELPVRA